MVSISAEASQAIQTVLDAKTSEKDGLVGTVFAAIGRDGQTLFQGASGVQQYGSDKKVSALKHTLDLA